MRTTDERKAAAEQRAIWLRNYQRARGRALVRLAKENRERFKELFQEERLSDEANGKAWGDLSGGHSPTKDSAGLPDGNDSVSKQQANPNKE